MYAALVFMCVAFLDRGAARYPYFDTQDYIYNVPKVYRVSISLDKLLDYYERKPSKDPEWYIALGIARGQLEYTINQLAPSVPRKLRENLRNVTRRMDRVRSGTKNLLYRSKDYEYVAKSMLENLNIHAGIMRPLTLGTLNATQVLRYTYEHYVKLAATKAPTRKKIDACSMQLLLSAMESQKGKDGACELPSECGALLTQGSALAYQMTSRLRAAQLAHMFDCMARGDHDVHVHRMCEHIYREARSLEAWEHPAGTDTLFMQQILYCSTQGFGEFIKPRWMNSIMSWQRPSGCYADERRTFQRLTAFTRASEPRAGGEREHASERVVKSDGRACDSLASGAALGALAVYVRALLESDDAFQNAG